MSVEKKIVVIMPTYKEADNISKMIPALVGEEFKKIDAEMHLLVMNDLDSEGKDDGTGDIVRKEMKTRKTLHLLEGKKQGLGWAYIRGMKYG